MFATVTRPIKRVYRLPMVRMAIATFSLAMVVRLAGAPILPGTDEDITLHFIREYGTLELLWMIPLVQPHFPTYYAIVDVWGWFFPLESARVLSIVAGAAVPMVATVWFAEFIGRRRAFLVGTVLAISPPLAAQSNWLRMYALLTLAVLVSWWAAWAYLNSRLGGRYYALTAMFAVSLHPFGVAAVGAQLSWLAYEQYRADWRPWFRPVAVGVGCLCAVLLMVLLARVAGVLTVYSIDSADMHIQYANMPVTRALALPIATVTGTAVSSAAAAVMCVVSGWCIWRIYTDGVLSTPKGRMAVAWIVVSLGILAAGHAIRPIVLLKYVTWIAPAVGLLVVGVYDGRRSDTGILAVFVALTALNLAFVWLFGMNVAMETTVGSGVFDPGAL